MLMSVAPPAGAARPREGATHVRGTSLKKRLKKRHTRVSRGVSRLSKCVRTRHTSTRASTRHHGHVSTRASTRHHGHDMNMTCTCGTTDPSAEQADVASPLQLSECIIQIPGAKKYRLEGTRRRPDNIGQIPMEKMLSPVLCVAPRTTSNCRASASPRARLPFLSTNGKNL